LRDGETGVFHAWRWLYMATDFFFFARKRAGEQSRCAGRNRVVAGLPATATKTRIVAARSALRRPHAA